MILGIQSQKLSKSWIWARFRSEGYNSNKQNWAQICISAPYLFFKQRMHWNKECIVTKNALQSWLIICKVIPPRQSGAKIFTTAHLSFKRVQTSKLAKASINFIQSMISSFLEKNWAWKSGWHNKMPLCLTLNCRKSVDR